MPSPPAGAERRWAPLCAGASLVLALHAATGWGLSQVMRGSAGTGGAAGTGTGTGSAPTLQVHIIGAARPGHLAAAATAAVTAPPAALAASAPPPSPAGTDAEAAGPAAHEPALPSRAAERTVFLPTTAVDQPSQPAAAWTLDAEALAVLGLTLVVFDTWVDAQAELVALRVHRVEPVALQGLTPLIETRLLATPMRAARKDGQAVAHQQRIELRWQTDGDSAR